MKEVYINMFKDFIVDNAQKERIKLDADTYDKIINDEFDDWNMINLKFTSPLNDGVCDNVALCEDIIKNLHKRHGVPSTDVAKARLSRLTDR
jgi:phage pi2 protein 07